MTTIKTCVQCTNNNEKFSPELERSLQEMAKIKKQIYERYP